MSHPTAGLLAPTGPMSRRLAPLAVAAVVLLAGCGTFAGGGTPEPVTPAPVPTTAPPADGDAGALDARRIVERHERALANRSFTTHSRIRVRGPDGTVRFRLEITGKRDATGRVRFDRRESTTAGARSAGRLQFYWEGGRTVYRYTLDSGTANLESVYHPPGIDLTRRDRLETVLSGLAVGRVDRYPGGDTEVSGTVTNASAIPTTIALEEPRNASLTARIAQDDLIEGIAVRYDASFRGNHTEVRYALAFENVSSTAIERPPWMAGLHGTGS